jgi:membrane protein DedA with SNARE-associated domain
VEEWFDRRGEVAVLVGRLVPGVRSLVSLPAGTRRMPVTRFVLLTALGSGIWNTLLVGAGIVLPWPSRSSSCTASGAAVGSGTRAPAGRDQSRVSLR